MYIHLQTCLLNGRAVRSVTLLSFLCETRHCSSPPVTLYSCFALFQAPTGEVPGYRDLGGKFWQRLGTQINVFAHAFQKYDGLSARSSVPPFSCKLVENSYTITLTVQPGWCWGKNTHLFRVGKGTAVLCRLWWLLVFKGCMCATVNQTACHYDHKQSFKYRKMADIQAQNASQYG